MFGVGKEEANLGNVTVNSDGFFGVSVAGLEEYLSNLGYFLSAEMYDKPVIFELFTNSQDESDAIFMMNNLEISATGAAKKLARNILGEKGVKTVKGLLSK